MLRLKNVTPIKNNYILYICVTNKIVVLKFLAKLSMQKNGKKTQAMATTIWFGS